MVDIGNYDQIKIKKKKGINKVDGIVATANAMAAYLALGSNETIEPKKATIDKWSIF